LNLKEMPWNKRMKLLRVSLDLTQEDMAQQLGIQSRQYWRWEHGEYSPKDPYKKRIAELLGVPVGEIFD